MRIEQQMILLEHFHEVQEELDLARGRRQVLTRKRATVLAALVVFSRRLLLFRLHVWKDLLFDSANETHRGKTLSFGD